METPIVVRLSPFSAVECRFVTSSAFKPGVKPGFGAVTGKKPTFCSENRFALKPERASHAAPSSAAPNEP